MKLRALLLATAAVATLATSCKKDDNKNNSGGNNSPAPSASTLASGTGYIAFTTDKAFNGNTNHVFKSQPPTDNSGVSNSSNSVTIQNTQTQISGANLGKTSSAQLQIRDVKTGNFDFAATAVSFVIAVTSGTTASESYAMSSGALEVTKYSTSEIEGKFSGKGVNEDAKTEISITNGTFSAKF